MADLEVDEFARIHDAHEIADEIACERRNDSAVDAPVVNEENVEDNIGSRSDERRPHAVRGFLCCHIDGGEELVETHHDHGDNQHRCVEVAAGVFGIGGVVDQDGRKKMHKTIMNAAPKNMNA